MARTPHPHQRSLIGSVVEHVVAGQAPLLQAPTGCGKTVMATELARWALAQGWVVFFACHRRELVHQTSGTFTEAGLAHSFIAAGRPFDRAARLFVCSVDTLKSRHARLPVTPDLVLWDECHHLTAEGWSKLAAYYASARHVGLTATPTPGLDQHFVAMVAGPQVSWLIEHGYLSPYRYLAPSMPELSAIGLRGGEYKPEQAAKAMKRELTGDAIAHYKRHCPGTRAVAFCVNIEHSKATAAEFCAAGIPAAHLDGDTPDDERADAIRRYADGELLVLTNVGLFGEGFDLAALAGKPVTIDALFLLRPTKSLNLCIQMWGRVLRFAPGKVAWIFDHAGCASEHGLPDDERHFHLDGRVTGPKRGDEDGPLPPAPATCSSCWEQIRRPLLSVKCPHCGGLLVEPKPLPKHNDKELKELKRAEVEALRRVKAQQRIDAEVARDIRDMERAATHARKEAERAARHAAEIARKAELFEQRQREKEENWSCASQAELAQLGKRRGYPHPYGWAAKQWPFVEAKRRRSRALTSKLLQLEA